jgi:hypothetical protein
MGTVRFGEIAVASKRLSARTISLLKASLCPDWVHSQSTQMNSYTLQVSKASLGKSRLPKELVA